jgi:type VI secretion system protein ImpJ
MSKVNKVVWSEGMFLRHHHFQQQDRYSERMIKSCLDMLMSYPFGFSRLTLDQQHLALGRVAINECMGIFPDGTLFDTNIDCEPPSLLEVAADLHNSKIYLAVPLRGVDSVETAMAGAAGLARYVAKETQVRDTTSDEQEAVPINVGRLHLRLLTDKDDLSQFAVLPIAKVIEKRADGSIILDAKFIPPCLDTHVSPVITGFMQELQGLLYNRGEDLAGRVAKPDANGQSSMLDFLLLQLVNRYETFLKHLSKLKNLHPERFYEELLKLLGELSTVTSAEKRITDDYTYNQDDLAASFTPVMDGLRQALSVVLEQTAVPLALQTAKQGIRVAMLKDKMLLNNAKFVLAVKADMSNDNLRSRFPAQIKIGPLEKIRGLINVQIPGIALEAMAVAPPEMPYHAGFTYFELEAKGPFWKYMQDSAGFAFHLSGDFPGLELEFWAVKSS